jgi:hypothetical protein
MHHESPGRGRGLITDGSSLPCCAGSELLIRGGWITTAWPDAAERIQIPPESTVFVDSDRGKAMGAVHGHLSVGTRRWFLRKAQ